MKWILDATKEPVNFTADAIHVIANYMDDEIREQVHRELAPCTFPEFLDRYVELDPVFEDLLESEFGFVRQ